MSASLDKYELRKTNDFLEACYNVTANATYPLWGNAGAINTTLPFFLTQLFVVISVDRLLKLVLKPLRQPQIVAHIAFGLLFGPTGFGESQFTKKYLFPYKTTMVLDTFANLAQVYYMFLIGLEVNFSLILHSGTQAISVAAAGICFPFLLGFVLYFLVLNDPADIRGSMFWAIVLTSTNFPALARMLSDLKLLRSNIGRIAMRSAIISDLCSWFLLVVALSIFNKNKYETLISTSVFTLICIYALRPTLSWLINQTSMGENVSDSHVWFILAGIVLCGFITDACGSHSIVGAFMFGVIMPQEDVIRSKVLEKLDDFVTEILLPLFFLTSGLRSDIRFMLDSTPWTTVLLVIVLSCVAKVVSVFFVSLRYNMPTQEGLALGLLMNTKGVMALIILNTGRDIKVLNNQAFPLMVLTLLIMSCLIEPMVALAYRPTRRNIIEHNNRSIQGTGSEFRILACVHSMRNVMGTLSLIDLSTTKKSHISVFAIHLLELPGRARTSMLIVHDDDHKVGGGNMRRRSRVKTDTSRVICAFENFEKMNKAVTVQTMTVVSPYTTMHMDICSLAQDKRVNLVIIPFHKQLIDAEGRMGDGNSNIADVNLKVLSHASCSVGILVDREIADSKHIDPEISRSFSDKSSTRRIAMLYVGGPDDREALAYAWRMAGNANVSLTVARFHPAGHEQDHDHNAGVEELNHDYNINNDVYREKQVDDEYMEEFKLKSIMNNSSITFVEKVVSSGEETIVEIKAMGNSYDLYVIGRRQGIVNYTPVTSGLSDWGSYPVLGAIGDTLASSNFALHASVLVVQHYISTDNVDTCVPGFLL